MGYLFPWIGGAGYSPQGRLHSIVSEVKQIALWDAVGQQWGLSTTDLRNTAAALRGAPWPARQRQQQTPVASHECIRVGLPMGTGQADVRFH